MSKTTPKAKEGKKESILTENVRWTWKDGNLESVSLNPSVDKNQQNIGHRVKKNKQGAAISYVTNGKKKQNFNLVANSQTAKQLHKIDKVKYTFQNASTSPRPRRANDTSKGTVVTLADVKRAALDAVLDETGAVNETFQRCIDTLQLDTFLMAVLHYFAAFIEKTEEDRKPTIMENPWQREANLRNTCSTLRKLKFASKKLGQAYCVLVMGLGLEEQHHMQGGKSRVSAIFTDRDAFENLYAFSTCVVNIAFRRQYFNEVTKEMGRLFRSEMYNIALHKEDDVGDDRDPHESEIKRYVDVKVKELRAKKKEFAGGYMRQTVNSKVGHKKSKPSAITKSQTKDAIDALVVAVQDFNLTNIDENKEGRKIDRDDQDDNSKSKTKDSIEEKRNSITPKPRPVRHLPKRPPINSLIKDFKVTSNNLGTEEDVSADELAQLESNNVGIIGEPIEKFNKTNLMPFVDDGDDSEGQQSHHGTSYQNGKNTQDNASDSKLSSGQLTPNNELKNNDVSNNDDDEQREELKT
ncbi:uncharacterized protein TRIADDRAFT_59834 [Trichoplax adhaerens]|uniref:Protein phosphatase 1 regulatory subunit 36 n=1 Tax=Trichoplax adhaerens TaxID=10228 RepID=B3S6K2_TRIAD|nr:hypothetical protein TRIADDRAFT_59834 [Trichoplax adhaerens]EDV21776.1 hypothetical protein TRIADDRAFT_59834 [Trichoplax adhaerens]|eukprot:XP_002115924.1 hypothetical protein TRIADDRAFT_59834 [Trichoplax adhaerens]